MQVEKPNHLDIVSVDTQAIEIVLPENKTVVRQIGSEAVEELVQIKPPEVHHLTEAAEQIKARVAGHDEDIDSIMHAISGQAFRDKYEPYSILITGPEGSGKSETAHAIADVLADGKYIKVDCSIFKPGLEPAQIMTLPFAEYQNNFNITDSDEDSGEPDIVIFENIENGSLELHEYLSSGAMENGKFPLYTNQGVTTITVSNSIFLFTSRLGTDTEVSRYFNNDHVEPQSKARKTKSEIEQAASRQLKQLNERLVEKLEHRVYYESLSDEALGDVLDSYVGAGGFYDKYGISVTLSPDVRDEIVNSISPDKRNTINVVKQYEKLVQPDLSRIAGRGLIPDNHRIYITKEADGSYGYFDKIDPEKLAHELGSIQAQIAPLLEREEELIQALETQGIGVDANGVPIAKDLNA